MQNETQLQLFFKDFQIAFSNYRKVIPFIRKHRLWVGLNEYGWAMKFMLIVAAVLSLNLVGTYIDWLTDAESEGISLAAVGGLVQNVSTEAIDLFRSGGFKYVVLILLEVVIFHFSRKTHEILTKEKADSSLKTFIGAQIRMLKVVIFCYVMETVFSLLAGTIISLVNLEMIKPAILILIQCFFLGFTFIDNYNEIYEMPVKESFKYTRQFAGAAIAIGIVVYVLMLLPVLGTLLAPLLGAVTATITMYELEQREKNYAKSLSYY